jgi:hypothetical protein
MDDGLVDLTQVGDDLLVEDSNVSLQLSSEVDQGSNASDTLNFTTMVTGDESMLVDITGIPTTFSSPLKLNTPVKQQPDDVQEEELEDNDLTPRASSPVHHSMAVEFFERDSPNATPRRQSPVTPAPILTTGSGTDLLSLESLLADIDLILSGEDSLATPASKRPKSLIVTSLTKDSRSLKSSTSPTVLRSPKSAFNLRETSPDFVAAAVTNEQHRQEMQKSVSTPLKRAPSTRLPKFASSIPTPTRMRSFTSSVNLDEQAGPIIKSKIPMPALSRSKTTYVKQRKTEQVDIVSEIQDIVIQEQPKQSPGRAMQFINRLSNMKLRSPKVRNPFAFNK